MLAAKICDRNTAFVFLQNPNDLLFSESTAFYILVLVLAQNELQTGLGRGGKVTIFLLLFEFDSSSTNLIKRL